MNDNLETIAAAVLFAGSATVFFAGIPLAFGRSRYAAAYNRERRQEFLHKTFGEAADSVVTKGGPWVDELRPGIILQPFELGGERYVLELQHKKTMWLADLFYDKRLYEPIGVRRER